MKSSLLTSCILATSTILWVATGTLGYAGPADLADPDLVTLEEILSSRINPGSYDDLLTDLELQRMLASPPSDRVDLLFPSLTGAQLKFGVNPSYREYTDPIFGDPSALSNDDTATTGDEIVEDPFASNDKYQIPKKASLKAFPVDGTSMEEDRMNDVYFTTTVAVSSALAVFVIVGAGFVYHKARRNAKAAEDVEYPAYGVTGPGKETSPTSGDRKLAQNAQLYHYQHQKQQMLAFDSNAGPDRRNGTISDNESDDGEEGDYTVYECPGLASTGEMEVRNPMFDDEPTPKAGEGPTSK